MYCRHCGKEIRDNASFCPFCGQPVESGNKLDKQNNTKRKKKRFWIFSVLGLIVLLLLAGGKAIYSLYSKIDSYAIYTNNNGLEISHEKLYCQNPSSLYHPSVNQCIYIKYIDLQWFHEYMQELASL